MTAAVAALDVFLQHTAQWQVDAAKQEAEDKVKELKARLAWLQLTLEDVEDEKHWWEIQQSPQLRVKLEHLQAQHKALEMKHYMLRETRNRLLDDKAQSPPKRRRLS